MKFWNEDRTQSPAIDIGDLEKYMSQKNGNWSRKSRLDKGRKRTWRKRKYTAEDRGTPQLNNANTTQGKAENTDQDDLANTHEMAFHLGLPSLEPLDLRGGNVSENWKKFKQKYTNYEIAAGVNTKESATRVVTLLSVIGNDGIDVFNTDMECKRWWQKKNR